LKPREEKMIVRITYECASATDHTGGAPGFSVKERHRQAQQKSALNAYFGNGVCEKRDANRERISQGRGAE
jgi:hypothetical protein